MYLGQSKIRWRFTPLVYYGATILLPLTKRKINITYYNYYLFSKSENLFSKKVC